MAFGQTNMFASLSWGGAALTPGYDEHDLRPIAALRGI